MKLKLGYTPLQGNHQISIEETENLARNASCDFENVYLEEYTGYHGQPYNHRTYPLSHGGFSEFFTSEGLRKIEEHAAKKYAQPIKAVWEFVTHLEGHDFQKIVFSLVEENEIPHFTIQRITKIGSEAKQPPLVKIKLNEFTELYSGLALGNLNFLNQQLVDELKAACDFCKYPFEEIELNLKCKNIFYFKTNDAFYAIVLAQDNKSFNFLTWQKGESPEVQVHQEQLPSHPKIFKNKFEQKFYYQEPELCFQFLGTVLSLDAYCKPDEEETKTFNGYYYQQRRKKLDTTIPSKIQVEKSLHLYKQESEFIGFTVELIRAMKGIQVKPMQLDGRTISLYTNLIFHHSHTDDYLDAFELVNFPNKAFQDKISITGCHVHESEILVVAQRKKNKEEFLFLVDRGNYMVVAISEEL